MSRSSGRHPPTRILKVYIETLTGFRHIFSPDGLNNTLVSQGFIYEKRLPLWEQRGDCISQGQGRE